MLFRSDAQTTVPGVDNDPHHPLERRRGPRRPLDHKPETVVVHHEHAPAAAEAHPDRLVGRHRVVLAEDFGRRPLQALGGQPGGRAAAVGPGACFLLPAEIVLFGFVLLIEYEVGNFVQIKAL